MSRVQIPRLNLRAMLALLVMAGTLALATITPAAARSGAVTALVTPDFQLQAPIGQTGFIVRGGLPTCTGPECTGGLVEPKYNNISGDVPVFYWAPGGLSVIALNGFRGIVTFDLLNPPPGITLQTAPVTLTDTTICCGLQVGVMTTLSLRADTTVPVGAATVTLRATNGALVHTAQLTLDVVDQLPATILFDIDVTGVRTVTGGDAKVGVLTLTNLAPAGGIVVPLSSSNPAVATVPASVTVPAGINIVNFPVTTAPVTAPVDIRLSATFNGQTIISGIPLQVMPANVDTVGITKAEYVVSKGQLSVEATSTNPSATLQVFVTATGQLIGTLTNAGGGSFKGQFNWPTVPDTITVGSSSFGSDTRVPALK